MSEPQKRKTLRFERYQVRRKLGEGAYSTVYAAWDPKLGREVALKVLPQRQSTDAKVRERFLREAKAIASLNHPNIVTIYDYSGPSSEELFLVIQKLSGQDLYTLLGRRGPMPEALVASIGYELCSALAAAHAQGIIHRDIKPENVMLSGQGHLVLTDFGVVKAIASNAQVNGFDEPTEVIGTPGFMAPELMKGKPLTPAIDIYALGVLLYNLLTGTLPFKGQTPLDVFRAAMSEKYEDPRHFNPLFGSSLCELINQCLQAQPKKRPESAEKMQAMLREILNEQKVSDVRMELSCYIERREEYERLVKRRLVQHVIAQVQSSCIEQEFSKVQQHLQHLNQLVPSWRTPNHAVATMLEPYLRWLSQSSSGRLSAWLPRAALPSGRFQPLAAIVAGFMVFACVGYGLWQLSGHRSPAPAATAIAVQNVPPKVSVSAASPSTGSVDVTVHALQKGVIYAWVDGSYVGKIGKTALQLNPGKHALRLRQRQKKIDIQLDVQQQSHPVLWANFSKQKVVVVL